MRFDHIDNFNQACASVAKLAAEAIAEHRRQIALIESIGREAAALADRAMPELPRPDRKAAPLAPPLPEPSRELTSSRSAGAPADQGERSRVQGADDDILGLAMRRADHDLPMFERTNANDFGGRPAATPASADGSRESDADPVDRGRGLVAALSGRKRARRLAQG
jgi:hypothetical protein